MSDINFNYNGVPVYLVANILQMVFETSLEGIILTDSDMKLTFVNNAFVDIVGYNKDELLDMKLKQLVDVTTWEEIKRQAITEKREETHRYEVILNRKDGDKRIVQLSVAPMRGITGSLSGSLSIVTNITEYVKMKNDLEKMNQMLKQSNKDLENYTYVVSHDLKAPLRAIRSFSSFLLEDYNNKIDDLGQDHLNRINEAASHMSNLIDDLLLLSRVGRKFTRINKVDLNILLNEIIIQFTPTVEKREARIIVKRALPHLSIQRTWIKQLFMNLIDNGLKFNSSKTPEVIIKWEEREEDYLFKVQDNGIGIEKRYFERIFNLFERLHTREEYDGTGAGLAICKKIIDQFEGKIWLESTLGKGSTFFFTIPKKNKDEEQGICQQKRLSISVQSY